jgi:hypothetical protein
VLNAEAQLAKAQSDLAKATNEANRRHHLPGNYISSRGYGYRRYQREGGESNAGRALKQPEATAEAGALADFPKPPLRAPVDGWITNLSTRPGNYATSGSPVFALVDSHSFYVVGYFEETKLRNIKPRRPAPTITLYNGHHVTLEGRVVSSIGRAIYDQSIETDSQLVADIKPNVPWVSALPSEFRYALSSPAMPAEYHTGFRHHLYRLYSALIAIMNLSWPGVAQYAMGQGDRRPMALRAAQQYCNVPGAQHCLRAQSG